MPRIDDVKESEAKKNYRLLRRTSRVTPGNNQSVTGGRTRFIGNESLIVIGSQLVSGWLVVTGWLKVVGTLLMEGFLSITGNVTSTGIWNQNGPWNLAGTGGITGDVASTGSWTQSGTYTVTAGGKIIITGTRPMTVGLTSSGFPGVEFPTGLLTSSNSGVSLAASSGGAVLGLTSAIANLSKGSTGVSADGTEVNVLGPLVASAGLKLTNLPTTPAAGKTPNLWQDPATKIVYRLT